MPKIAADRLKAIGEALLLVNRDWVDPRQFAGCEFVAVPSSEAWAPNTLLVDGTLLVSAAFGMVAFLRRPQRDYGDYEDDE